MFVRYLAKPNKKLRECFMRLSLQCLSPPRLSLCLFHLVRPLTSILFSIPLFLLASVWPGSADAKEIRIGIAVDQSGINADMARDYLAGARTYFDHINAAGGINGRKITVIVKDDEGVPANTVRLSRELIEKDRADVLFGYMGDENVTALSKDPFFKASRVTLFAPLAGIDLKQTGGQIFFLRPTYREEAKHIVQHFSTLGTSSFLIVSSQDALGTVLGDELAAELQAKGKPAIARLTLDTSLKNVNTITSVIKQRKPQLVIMAGDTLSTAGFLREYRLLDTATSVVGFSTVNHRTLVEMVKGNLVAGTMLTQVVPHPGANQSKLQSEHRTLMKIYRDEPPSHLTLEGFAAAKCLVRALERSKEATRANITAAFNGERRFDLEGMTLAYGESGDGAHRGSEFVDLAFLRKTGQLIQ
jgi:branched-chain amino acid transport system substrate-binding protein